MTRAPRFETENFMGRLIAFIIAVAIAAPAEAGTSLLGGGAANWFYACAGTQPMNIVIRHTDNSLMQFSLLRGESVRTPVQRGDVVAWRCGAPVDLAQRFIFIVTLPGTTT